MESWLWRVAFFICTLLLASLFYSTAIPYAGSSIGTIITLTFSAVLVAEMLRYIALYISPKRILNAILAPVIGFSCALIIVFCLDHLFPQGALPYPFDPLARFLFPITASLMAFWSLHSFSFFHDQGSLFNESSLDEKYRSRKLVPDLTVLEDGRVVDLVRTGIFDSQIIVPTFLPKQLRSMAESEDEFVRSRAKKATDSLRRLEALDETEVTFIDYAYKETHNIEENLISFTKTIDGYLLTGESALLKSDLQHDKYVSIDAIANALRPPIPKGEVLAIKIQRLGKEAKQGIGYLDDGTMVVVNGGGDFLGKTVKTQVLSQKFSSSGKIVFCNVRDESFEEYGSPYTYPEHTMTTTSL